MLFHPLSKIVLQFLNFSSVKWNSTFNLDLNFRSFWVYQLQRGLRKERNSFYYLTYLILFLKGRSNMIWDLRYWWHSTNSKNNSPETKGNKTLFHFPFLAPQIRFKTGIMSEEISITDLASNIPQPFAYCQASFLVIFLQFKSWSDSII